MINVNQLTSQLRMLPDQALQRVAQMYKNDPYIFPMVISEGMARKKLRAAGQAQMTQPQPKVTDQALMAMAPEDAGIAGLQAPNMEGMADGGIAGYAEGGMANTAEDSFSRGGMFDFAQRSEPVIRMAEGGKKGEDAFERAVNFVLGVEGDKYVENDAGKGPSKFGILQSANPGVDVKKLTKDQAKEIYRKNYWDAINGDELSKTDPRLATVMFDTAVNHGQGTAKTMLQKAEGNPERLLQLRNDFYSKLIQDDPKRYSQYSKGWTDRLGKLSTEIGSQEERPRVGGLSAADLVKARAGSIPGSELRVGDRRYTYEGELIPEARARTTGEKLIGAGETALSFLSAIPGSVAGTATSLGRAALRGEAPTEQQFAKDVARFTYAPRTEAGQELTEETAKGIASVLPAYIPAATAPSRAVAAARAARQAEQAAVEAAAARAGVQAPRLAPPGTVRMTPEEIAAAKAKVEAPRLPAPGATPEQQQAGIAALTADKAAAAAARRNPAEAAASEANTARLVRQQAADVAAADAAAGRAGTAAQEAARVGAQAERAAEKAGYADFGRAGNVGALAATTQAGTADKKPIVPEKPPTAVVPPNLTDKEQEKVVEAAKSAVKDPSKAEGWTNDDWLNFGFALLANRSPYFMEAVGMAGLKTLAAKQEKAKLLEESEYRKAQMAKLKAEAAYITDTKAKSELYNRATRLAQAQINALKANPQSFGLTPEQVEEKSNDIIRRIYSQLLQQEGMAGETTAAPAKGGIPSTPPPGAVKQIG